MSTQKRQECVALDISDMWSTRHVSFLYSRALVLKLGIQVWALGML